MFYHLFYVCWKETINNLKKKKRIFQASLYGRYVAQAVASQSTYVF